MAKGGNDGEHKMLFDLQGKRRNVVKVVYAILAVLMGLSLFLVIGPAPLQDIFGIEDSVSNVAEPYEEQIERLDVKLKQDPADPTLLFALTKAHVNAGNALAETTETGEVTITPESRQQYEAASESWSEYLQATSEPAAGLAQQMSTTLITLAQTSTRNPEAEANLKAATEAQELVAEDRPSLNSLTTLAFYLAYTFEYDRAKEVADEAKAFANSKFERQQIDNQLAETERAAKEFEKNSKEIQQAGKEAAEAGAGGEAKAPLGGSLGGATLSE